MKDNETTGTKASVSNNPTYMKRWHRHGQALSLRLVEKEKE